MRRLIPMILFQACTLAAAVDFPPFPRDAFGVWGAGTSPTVKWKFVEPEDGRYTFDRELGQQLRDAADRKLPVYIKLWVGEDSPGWIYEAGVPKVEVPPHINPLGKRVQHVYPHYLSDKYREYYYRLIHAFANYVHSLPAEVRERIVFVQVCEGSTGDGQPYKSQPVNPAYRISFDQWSDFRMQAWQVYADAFQKGRAFPVRLLVNGDANREKENAWLIANWPQIGVKQGMFSHGYVVSDTTDRVEAFLAFKKQAQDAGAFVFTRGEQDGEWKTYGWSTKNPEQAFYWSALFALQCGLDTWQVPPEALKLPGLKPAVDIFNRYAGIYDPGRSPGAFCALARGLDVADTDTYPEDRFGVARRDNRERYLAIVKVFAARGAMEGDVEKAMSHGMVNRKARDYNDAGWKIWPGNYEKFLRQIDPESTSVAWWHVEPKTSIYSRFARGLDTTGGKTAMYFDLDDGFFPAEKKARPVDIRVVYLDRGEGSWRLLYHAVDAVKTAATVSNKDSGEWKDLTVSVADGWFANGCARQSDIVLEQMSGSDALFHMVEVTRK